MRIVDLPSPNFDERTRAIELIVLHYTGMADAQTAIDRLRDPAPRAGVYAAPGESADDPSAMLGRVSAHYVVEEGGRILALVPEEKVAWHAGAGEWAGESDLNARSVGIEIVNGGHDFGLPDFPDAQIRAVIDLVGDIARRRALKPHQIIGHSDVAPARKADPGEKFPWPRLADAGLALWPRIGGDFTGDESEMLSRGDEGPQVRALQAMLSEIGYGLAETGVFDEDTEHVLRAFQRRFRPGLINGEGDAQTKAIARDVLAQTQRLRLAR